MNGKLKYNFLLMLAALIWGSAFVAQSVGMDYLGPFTFNSVRSFMGSLVLLPVIWFMDRQKKDKTEAAEGKNTIEENTDNRRPVLRRNIDGIHLFAADWADIHDGGKSRIYYGTLYFDRTSSGAVSRQKGRRKDLDRRCFGCNRNVFIMY